MLSGNIPSQAPLRAYLVALALTLVAVWLRESVDPWLGSYLPFAMMYGTVALASWIGGAGPGIFAASLGYLLTDLLVLQPHAELSLLAQRTTQSIVVSLIYVLSCGTILWVGTSLRRARYTHEIHERELKRIADARQLLLTLHDTTRELLDPEEVIWQIVNHVGRHLKASRCMYCEIDDRANRILIARDYGDGVPSIAGLHRLDDFGARMIETLKAGMTVVVDDVKVDPMTCEPNVRANFELAQTAAVISVPLIKKGRYVAAFAVQQQEARHWTRNEVQLLEQVAEHCWFAVDTARSNAALRESRGVLALAMRGGHMGTWSYDPITERFKMSPEVEEILGLPCGTGEYPFEQLLALLHPDEVASVQRTFESAVATGADFRAEFRVRVAPDTWRWMDSSTRCITGPEGKPHMFHGVCIDITERHLAIDAQRDATRRKDEFLATLAHELRNPLAPIRSAIEVLRLNTPSDQVLQAAQDTIDRQVRHLTRLVDDLLDAARYTRGKIHLHKTLISLDDALRDAVDSVRHSIDSAGQHLDIQLPDEALLINGDSTRVVQVILNLLNNASKYTAPGGQISVRVTREGQFGAISVRDNGIGIAPDQLQHLFEMFSQAPPSPGQVSEGLGIGLALVRAFAEMHGGSVEARSEGLGKGSEFTVRFPLRQRAASAAPALPAPVPAASAGRLRVLLVDDNRDAADTLECLLQLAGHEVHVAYDGPSAVIAATQLHPDAVLLDLGLPGMSGLDVACYIRQQAWGTDMMLIALTGWGRDDDKLRTAEARFDHHLVKPTEFAEVEAVLAKRKLAGISA